MARYLVTGGSGFLGRALIKHIRAKGHEAIIATRVRPEGPDEQYWVEYDLRDRATIPNLVQAKADGVFHLAWSTTPATAEADPAEDVHVNLAGTVALFAELSKLSGALVVFISSGGTVYGQTPDLPIKETHRLAPIGAYGATKAAAETYAAILRGTAGIDVRIVRLSNPFGISQSSVKMQGAASIFARKIVNNETIDIWGDGSIIRDYIFVDDAVAAIFDVISIERSEPQLDPIYNVGSGEGTSLLELIRTLAAAAGVEPHLSFTVPRFFDIPANVLDISKIRQATGWQPAHTTKAHLERLVETLKDAGDSRT